MIVMMLLIWMMWVIIKPTVTSFLSNCSASSSCFHCLISSATYGMYSFILSESDGVIKGSQLRSLTCPILFVSILIANTF
jgi:hypothetical protein